MRELIDDPFYELIQDTYDRCVIDYHLIEDKTPYQGYRSHKDAVLFAMIKQIERYIDEQLASEVACCKEVRDEPFPWNLDIGRAQAVRIDPEKLLLVPKIVRKIKGGSTIYDQHDPDVDAGEQIPYWYAFLEPPQYFDATPEDFERVNASLFPKGTDGLEVYEWTTDWSNYFEAGHEWWGTACWSVYDRRMDRYIVIMASATD